MQRARELGRPLDLDRGKETVADFIERWWRDYALVSLTPNTRDGYARAWDKHLRSKVGGHRLRDVTLAVVDGLRAELITAGVGLPTVRKAFALLSCMFRCAVLWDRIDRNPVREVKLARAKASRHVRLSSAAHGRGDAGAPTGWRSSARRGARVTARLCGCASGRGSGSAMVRRDGADAPGRACCGRRDGKRYEDGSDQKRSTPGPLAEDLERWQRASSPSAAALIFPASGGTASD